MPFIITPIDVYMLIYACHNIDIHSVGFLMNDTPFPRFDVCQCLVRVQAITIYCDDVTWESWPLISQQLDFFRLIQANSKEKCWLFWLEYTGCRWICLKTAGNVENTSISCRRPDPKHLRSTLRMRNLANSYSPKMNVVLDDDCFWKKKHYTLHIKRCNYYWFINIAYFPCSEHFNFYCNVKWSQTFWRRSVSCHVASCPYGTRSCWIVLEAYARRTMKTLSMDK